jgi:hypothetical protein
MPSAWQVRHALTRRQLFESCYAIGNASLPAYAR